MEFDMSYLFFKDINREEFDEFVKNHEYCNLLQSYNWAKVKSNWDHMYTGVYKDNVLVATGLVLIKRLPLSFCMYYLPRGPIMDYKDNVLVQYYFDQLKKIAKKIIVSSLNLIQPFMLMIMIQNHIIQIDIRIQIHI